MWHVQHCIRVQRLLQSCLGVRHKPSEVFKGAHHLLCNTRTVYSSTTALTHLCPSTSYAQVHGTILQAKQHYACGRDEDQLTISSSRSCHGITPCTSNAVTSIQNGLSVQLPQYQKLKQLNRHHNQRGLLEIPATLTKHCQYLSPRPQQQQQQQRTLHLAPPFLVDGYIPVATTTYRLGKMDQKVQAAQQELLDCRVCPRNCGVNRLQDELGVCGVGRKLCVSTVAPHFAEEDPLKGWNGSGTVFFSMCNLRCVFCQNWDISQRRAGFDLTACELADWMLKLQEEGRCHNINFVTPEHVSPQVVEAIAAAVAKGLNIPIVYNTSSYDGQASLALMDGLVDIYLPDFKFWTAESSQKYAKAKDYPDVARAAIKEMHRQVGDLVFSSDGLAKRGLLLRHLVMPGLLEEGKAILDWVVAELGPDTFIHIMEQYQPQFMVGKGEHRSRGGWSTYEEINRRPSSEDVQLLRDYARKIGLWRFEELPRYEVGELAG